MLRLVGLFITLLAAGATGVARGAEMAAPLEVNPAEVHLAGPRDRVQAVLTAIIDGAAADVTSQAVWQSSDERVAVVDAGGVVQAAGDGACQLTVSYGAHQLSVPVTVTGCAQPLPVSFDHEVVPALTKAGCNSGKCHGSPSGKGGFALSLRGFDLAKDYSRLTRECGGRRLNLLEPAASLLLAKPQVRVPHGGGRRLADDGPLVVLLREWIAAGAPRRADDPPPAALEIFPSERWMEASVAAQQLRVVARWPDGVVRDITHLAHFTASPEGQAEVAPSGLVQRLRVGEVTVAAAFGPLHATSRLAFLPPVERFAWPAPPENNEIDRLAFARLRRLRIVSADLADDATFLRRAWLDVCGVLPSPDAVRRFLADGSPDKRFRLIDELLERPEYADFWAMKWSDRLGCNQRFVGKTGAIKYHAWIRHQVAANEPEDVFARRLLTASGGNYANPPAGFYRLPRTPEDRGEQVAQVFLGVRIGCARCHNHPGERWTQDDYYGLAACFARLRYRDGPFFNHIYDKEETVVPTRSGELRHGRTGEVVQPQPLGSEPLSNSDSDDRRQAFARWLTSPDNPFFARAAVNRTWAHLFGRGIVEPVDDFRSSNPPTHPELLDWLAAHFAAHGFDRKCLIRQIMRSRLYQLASTAPSPGSASADALAGQADVIPGDRYFAHAVPRLLGAEQLLDAIGQATGVPEKFAGFPRGLRAAELPDGEYQNRFLTAFGRPARALACACERDSESNLGQALELVGGESIEAQLHSPEGRIARLCAGSAGSGGSPAADNGAIIEDLFLATLSRFPGEQERRELIERLSASADRRAAAEDILWALINHPEFLFQH